MTSGLRRCTRKSDPTARCGSSTSTISSSSTTRRRSAPVAQGHPFQNGRGNAYDTPLREHDRGRIYRLVWKGAKPYTPLSLSASRPLELVQALRHDNMFWRTTAQRLLVERGKTDVVPQLIAIVNDRTVDRIGLNSPAVHALWTMHGLGVLDGRRNARGARRGDARAHPPGRRRAQGGAVGAAEDGAVGRGAALGWRAHRQGSERAAERAARAVADAGVGRSRPRNLSGQQGKAVIEDEWLPEAIWIAATRHQDGFLQAYADEVGLPELMRIARSRCARRAGRRRGLVGARARRMQTGKSSPAPKVWSETPLGDHVGTIWFRRTIDLPANAAGKPAEIRLGIVDDTDVTYVNGVRISATATSRNLPRQYSDSRGCPGRGSNVIAVRISNVNGRGGFVPDPAPAPGVSPLAQGIRADRHGHRRRRLHHPPRR